MAFRFLRPDAASVWKNPEIQERFSRYKGIIDGNKIARYLLAKTIPCTFDKQASVQDLQSQLKEKSAELRQLIEKDNTEILSQREFVENSFLDLTAHLAEKYLESCNFCERVCGINRIEGKLGYCQIPAESYLSSAFLHTGEESVLVPSGTIFFLGCNFGCVFCQNYDISQSWKNRQDPADMARLITPKRLAEIAESLGEKGALNINYVGGDPIPDLHTIIKSLTFQTENICQLWNSNFYLTEESLSLIVDLMDFWLPDFKYGNNKCGEKYSGVKNYFDIISRNHKVIHDEGSGEIIIRHLVMPNHVECCSKPILDFVASKIPKSVVNIMGQYRPVFKADKYSEINRRPSSEEMTAVKDYADQLGILFRPVS